MDERDPISNLVIGAAIEVHRLLGPGLLESVYQRALGHEFDLRDIRHLAQHRLPVLYKGISLGDDLVLDFLVLDEMAVELKAVDPIHPIHEAQLLTYMRLGEFHRGLLLNFNARLLKDGIKRMVL